LVGELIAELLLRLAKVLAALLLAIPIYLVAIALDPAAAGMPLGLVAYGAAAASLLLLASSPL
jgi:hypothetical protein